MNTPFLAQHRLNMAPKKPQNQGLVFIIDALRSSLKWTTASKEPNTTSQKRRQIWILRQVKTDIRRAGHHKHTGRKIKQRHPKSRTPPHWRINEGKQLKPEMETNEWMGRPVNEDRHPKSKTSPARLRVKWIRTRRAGHHHLERGGHLSRENFEP